MGVNPKKFQGGLKKANCAQTIRIEIIHDMGDVKNLARLQDESKFLIRLSFPFVNGLHLHVESLQLIRTQICAWAFYHDIEILYLLKYLSNCL